MFVYKLVDGKMVDSVSRHYHSQYRKARALNRKGKKHKALNILLALSKKRRVHIMILGATHYLIARIVFDDILSPTATIDAEKHARRSVNYYELLQDMANDDVNWEAVRVRLMKAHQLTKDCAFVKKDNYEWRNREKDDDDDKSTDNISDEDFDSDEDSDTEGGGAHYLNAKYDAVDSNSYSTIVGTEFEAGSKAKRATGKIEGNDKKNGGKESSDAGASARV